MPIPERKESDSSDKKGFRPEDEASYYLGNNFELGGVQFGNGENQTGEEEEKQRNLSRFGQEVWNEKDQLGVGQTDQTIREEVRSVLAPYSEVEVEVGGGVVWLRGFVNTREEKREVHKLVDQMSAVRDVMNIISVRSLH